MRRSVGKRRSSLMFGPEMGSRPQIHKKVPTATAVLLLCLVVGFSTHFSLDLVILASAFSVLVCLLAVSARLPSYFLGALSVALIGYAFLGKSFAYFGHRPIYIGEILLLLGVLGLALNASKISVHGLPQLLLILFILAGVVILVVHYDQLSVNSLRDSAIWIYSLFAILVASFATERSFIRIVEGYGLLSRYYVPWAFAAPLLYLSYSSRLPLVPGSDVPILLVKSGDYQVHLAGIAAFTILGLNQFMKDRRTALWPIIGLWFAAVVVNGSVNRGGLLALITAVSLAFLLNPNRKWVVVSSAIAILLLAVSLVLPSIELSTGRAISPNQIVDNALSIFGRNESGNLQGTVDWRMGVWQEILQEGSSGSGILIGQGFGTNLVSKAGFAIDADEKVRTPHSIHFSILGFMGLPALLLWLSFCITFCYSLLCRARLAKASDQLFWFGFFSWILCYFIAVFVNSSFDPYIEGPQGGIWFWSIVGLGMAASRTFDSKLLDGHKSFYFLTATD